MICNGLSTCQHLTLGAESHQNNSIPVYCWVGGSVEQWAERRFRHHTGLGLSLSSIF